MRPSIIALAGLFLPATLLGCGASATIPQPPSQVTTLPPGSTSDMTKAKKGAGGGTAPAKPSNQF